MLFAAWLHIIYMYKAVGRVATILTISLPSAHIRDTVAAIFESICQSVVQLLFCVDLSSPLVYLFY